MTLPTSCPKPPKRPAKRRQPPRARNQKRHDKEWARAYHSPERVAFVKSLMCVACLGFGGIVNAHIEGGGAGRKADYTKIIPLHDKCHRAWHARGDDFLKEWNLTQEDLQLEAEATERRWQRFQGDRTMNAQGNDAQRGLYEKFIVKRTDGSSERGGRHAGCQYFVLDVTHDPHAIPALRAYAESCSARYPRLAMDLLELAGEAGPNG